jgi:hypothetical protein
MSNTSSSLLFPTLTPTPESPGSMLGPLYIMGMGALVVGAAAFMLYLTHEVRRRRRQLKPMWEEMDIDEEEDGTGSKT